MAEDTEEGPPPVGPDSDRNNVSFASAATAVTDARCSDADVIDVDADRDQSNTAVSDMVALCCDGSRHQ